MKWATTVDASIRAGLGELFLRFVASEVGKVSSNNINDNRSVNAWKYTTSVTLSMLINLGTYIKNHCKIRRLQ